MSVLEGASSSIGVLARRLGRDPHGIDINDSLLKDLELDSLEILEVVELLRECGVDIEDTADAKLLRVADVVALLAKPKTVRLTFNGAALNASDIGVANRPTHRETGHGGPPVLSDGTIQLLPIETADLHFLYALATDPAVSYRWRYRGVSLTFEHFARDFWKGVHSQYVVVNADSRRRLGQVVSYQADPENQTAYAGAVFTPEIFRRGVAARAVTLFMDYLFAVHPLRKIYMEVPGFNYDQIASGEGRVFEREGRLRDHVYFNGKYWDLNLLAIYPTQTASLGHLETPR